MMKYFTALWIKFKSKKKKRLPDHTLAPFLVYIQCVNSVQELYTCQRPFLCGNADYISYCSTLLIVHIQIFFLFNATFVLIYGQIIKRPLHMLDLLFCLFFNDILLLQSQWFFLQSQMCKIVLLLYVQNDGTDVWWKAFVHSVTEPKTFQPLKAGKRQELCLCKKSIAKHYISPLSI